MKAKFAEGKLLLVPEEPKDLLEIIKHLSSTEVIDVDHDVAKEILMANGAKQVRQAVEAAAEVVEEEIAKAESTEGGKPPSEMTRDEVKEALTARGIPFNNKSRTNSLMTLLQQAKEGTLAIKPEPEADPEAGVEATPEEAGEGPTRDEVYQVLRQIITEQGKPEGYPKVKKLLAEYGAANISGVAEEHYPELKRKAQALLKGE